MKLLNRNEINSVAGGLDSITPACFDAVNYYASWWYYGLVNAETFNSIYFNYCTPPEAPLLIDSDTIDIIACVPIGNLVYVTVMCYS